MHLANALIVSIIALFLIAVLRYWLKLLTLNKIRRPELSTTAPPAIKLKLLLFIGRLPLLSNFFEPICTTF